MPEAAVGVGQRGIVGGIVEEHHAMYPVRARSACRSRDQRRRDGRTVALHDEADIAGPPPRAIGRGSPRCCPCRRARRVAADVRHRASSRRPARSRARRRSADCARPPRRRWRRARTCPRSSRCGSALGQAATAVTAAGPGRRRRHRPRDPTPPTRTTATPADTRLLFAPDIAAPAQRSSISFRRERGS